MYSTTTTNDPFHNLNTLESLLKRAAYMTFKNEGFIGFNDIYDELMTRPSTMLLTTRTKQDLDELFFVNLRESAAPFLLNLKINIEYLASSDVLLYQLVDDTINNVVMSLVSVADGVRDHNSGPFINSNAYMIKNTPVGYELTEKPCHDNGLGAWYCTMLLMYMNLPLFKELYDELTTVE